MESDLACVTDSTTTKKGEKGREGGVGVSTKGAGVHGGGDDKNHDEIHKRKEDCGNPQCRTSSTFAGPKEDREDPFK